MTQRLQVLLAEEEFEEIRRVAQRHRMTVAEWVRQAAQGSYPTADIDVMLAEIDRGYVGGES